jgi:hypothetical protein
MKLDNNSWKISTEKCLPHSAVVKKLRKYSKYKTEPLKLFRYSYVGEGDAREIIYEFNNKDYEKCVRKETAACTKFKVVQSDQGKVNIKLAHIANARRLGKK